MSFFSNAAPQKRNGDLVVGFTNADYIKQNIPNQAGYADYSTLSTWYQEDALKNHLKLSPAFGQQSMSSVPFFQDVLEHDAILEVNGWDGKFTYDLPVETDTRLKTADDTSNQVNAGEDGSLFKIVFNRDFAPGTTLSADIFDGLEIVISDAEPSRDLGYGFEMMATVNSDDPNQTYPSYLLAKDVEYFETGGGLAEYGERLNLVHMPGKTMYMTCEFQLGSPQGAEAWFTGKANSIDLKGGGTASMDYIKEIEQYYKNGKEIVLIKEKVGGTHKYTIGSIMEMLAIQKFNRNMSMSLMFQRGGTVKTQKGTVRYNEGLWHQMRRGEIITYGRRGGITRGHIQKIRDYIFKANPLQDTIDSVLVLKCGIEAYENILDIFKDEVNLQLANIAPLLGSDRLLPINPVKGDNYNLSLEPVRFTNVLLRGIGKVRIERDVTLSYVNGVDRNIAGFAPKGQNFTAYSVIVWDAMSSEYSNNTDFPKGVTAVGSNKDSNIYYVTPKGEKIYWGRENGRYSVERATDIVASAKTMHSSFFIYGFGAMWMKDPSRVVMLELEKSARKGYN